MAASFPWNSPYAFSENRVIDGVELEGLEYISYNVYLDQKGNFLRREVAKDYRNMNNKEVEKIHGISADKFYKQFSQSFGPDGRNVQFNYYQQNGTGTDILVETSSEQQTTADFWFGATYGLFAGQGRVTNKGPRFPDERKPGGYDFDAQPIDLVDAIARAHDFEEDNPAHQDWKQVKYVGADLRFLVRLKKYLKNTAKNDYVDPYTNRKPSIGAISFTQKAYSFFTDVVKEKIARIQKGVDYDGRKLSKFEYETYLRDIQDATKNETP